MVLSMRIVEIVNTVIAVRVVCVVLSMRIVEIVNTVIAVRVVCVVLSMRIVAHHCYVSVWRE